MKISAKRIRLDNWTVVIDGAVRTGLTRDEAWSAIDLAMSKQTEGDEP